MSLQVFIKLEGQKMSLIVDGISVQSNRISGRDRTRLTAPLYAGGVPASVAVSVSPAGSTLRLTPLCSEGRAFLLFFTLGTEALLFLNLRVRVLPGLWGASGIWC